MLIKEKHICYMRLSQIPGAYINEKSGKLIKKIIIN